MPLLLGDGQECKEAIHEKQASELRKPGRVALSPKQPKESIRIVGPPDCLQSSLCPILGGYCILVREVEVKNTLSYGLSSSKSDSTSCAHFSGLLMGALTGDHMDMLTLALRSHIETSVDATA